MEASLLLGGLLAIAAGAGLFLDPYRAETAFARNGFRGADLVSFAVVLRLLAVSAWAARRGSVRGLLLWLGAVGYVAYQYGYTFAYRWNRLFLVYLALLSLAGFTIVATLGRVDAAAVARRFGPAAPALAVSRFLRAIAVGLGGIELAQIVPTVLSGDRPELVTLTAHPTSPVYILDLGLVVPLMLVAAAWLRAGRPWGFVAAAVLLVKGATVGLGLLAANAFAVAGGTANDGALNLLWLAIASGSTVALWRFLRHIHDHDGPALVLACPVRKEA